MSAIHHQTMNLTAVLQWLARGLGVASVLTLLLFFIGEGFNPAALRLNEWVLMIFFPLGVIAGMVIAWWREGLGGGITIASLVAFYVAHLLLSGGLPRGWAFAAFASPGVLFLAYRLVAGHQGGKSYAA